MTIISGLRVGRSIYEIVRFNNLKKSLKSPLYGTLIGTTMSLSLLEASLRISALKENSTGGEVTSWLAIHMVDSLQDLINQGPGRSMRSLARELGINKKTVRNRMQQDICYKSDAIRRGQFMNRQPRKGDWRRPSSS
jgi:hypothetical protein